MDPDSRRLFRALRLLWNRMGSMRFYVLGAAATVALFAALGIVHLVSSARTGPAPSTHAAATAAETASNNAVIAITEIGSTETRGRNGQKNIAVRIGVAPRPQTKKGEVEIRFSFFDVTPEGEMRPTDAEVNYEWLTPVRDWSDPSPKYLVATYLGAGLSRKSGERLRYGGFLVRVYFDGQLQAERSEPKELVAALRSAAASPTVGPPVHTQSAITVATSSPTAPHTSAIANEPANKPTPTIAVTSSPSPVQANRDNSSAFPYASPVPDKPGFVYSPYNPKFLIDVRGFPPGTEVIDPNTSKPFKVP
jgi:hypothetical protein